MAESEKPLVVVIGGPNGAGKSTIVPSVLGECYQIEAYVNADEIAAELSPDAPEKVALQAGRMMLTRVHELAEARACFAFESTLSTRSFAPFIRGLREQGYICRLYFSWVLSPDISVARVARRVKMGGHHVPEADVRRRYFRAIRNLIDLYIPVADTWSIFDNSDERGIKLVARGQSDVIIECKDEQAWRQIQQQARSKT